MSMDVQNIKLLHDKPYRVSWKPEELNSVDFRLNIVKLNKPGLVVL